LYAYQADIVVREKNGKVPLVAVELKCGAGAGYTTHDVLTYSAKAMRHKELYPYLRYGMAIAGARPIGRKFFITNKALDFVVAFPVPDDDVPLVPSMIELRPALANCSTRTQRFTFSISNRMPAYHQQINAICGSIDS